MTPEERKELIDLREELLAYWERMRQHLLEMEKDDEGLTECNERIHLANLRLIDEKLSGA